MKRSLEDLLSSISSSSNSSNSSSSNSPAEVVQLPSLKRKIRVVFPTIKELPEINSLSDLIKISRTRDLYKYIDNKRLWDIEEYLIELNNLIGMSSIKETLLYQIIYYLQNFHSFGSNGGEYLHTAIFGNPGTGKTAVAKIIGNIYKELGILSKGTIKVAYRQDFIAGYLGQTAIKTQKLLDSCLGGVLVIDECYSLGNKQDRDSFSKECLDTLTAFLSENKKDFCCIICGYENDIRDCIFNTNKGLESRFPWIHKIDKYTPVELCMIFKKMIKDIKWNYSDDEKELTTFFEKNKDNFKNFGRDIETFITKCKLYHSKRVFGKNPELKGKLNKNDLEKAIAYIIENNSREKEDFSYKRMYI